jgi:hypothetical protein
VNRLINKGRENVYFNADTVFIHYGLACAQRRTPEGRRERQSPLLPQMAAAVFSSAGASRRPLLCSLVKRRQRLTLAAARSICSPTSPTAERTCTTHIRKAAPLRRTMLQIPKYLQVLYIFRQPVIKEQDDLFIIPTIDPPCQFLFIETEEMLSMFGSDSIQAKRARLNSFMA